MLSRPFLPFRVRPIHQLKVRPSPLQTADIPDVPEELKGIAVKAERRPVRATPVLAAVHRGAARPPR